MSKRMLSEFLEGRSAPFVVILGANEIASAVAVRLNREGYWVVMCHDPFPPVIRRGMAFYDVLFDEQVEIVDTIAERIQLLGGVSIAMAHDVAEMTQIERPPKGREEVPVQLSRLLDAHQILIRGCRELAERASKLGDEGTNDLAVSDVLRTNELQAWFLSEHLVNMPLVEAEE